MRVTILGSGTAVPDPDRFPSGVLVEAAGQVVLVDCGPGTLRRMAQAGVGIESLSAVLLTHYHTDHTADLAALLFALRNPRYTGRPPLVIRGGRGLRDLLDGLYQTWRWTRPRDVALDVDEIGPGSFSLGELLVTAVSVEHTPVSLAYRLEGDGARAAFSGDADVCPGLAEVAADVDLFVCDSAFPAAHRTRGHLTPALAAQAAAEARARRLCLTHFYPECDGHDLLAEAREHYSGEIVLAEDLLAFDLP